MIHSNVLVNIFGHLSLIHLDQYLTLFSIGGGVMVNPSSTVEEDKRKNV